MRLHLKKSASHAKTPKVLKFMYIGIAPYSLTEFGRSIPRARITVSPGENDLKPYLDFQDPGTYFRDRDNNRWKIISSEVVEELSPSGPFGEECITYHWEYNAEAVVERPNSMEWPDED